MAASVVTVARYRTVTLDTTSESAAVSAALESAQIEVEEWLRRLLTSGARTETLRLSSNGRVYPAATPVTAVTSPSGAAILDGVAISSVSPDSGPLWPGPEDRTYPLEVTVTYTGGYSAATLPRTIEKHIAWLAHQLIYVESLSLIPAGVSAVSVGDVSLSWGAGGASPAASLSQAAKAALRPWRRKRV